MPFQRNVSRTWKSQPRNKIILALTAPVLLSLTAVPVVEGLSWAQDPDPRAGPP
jgi:hypothetical protein